MKVNICDRCGAQELETGLILEVDMHRTNAFFHMGHKPLNPGLCADCRPLFADLENNIVEMVKKFWQQ